MHASARHQALHHFVAKAEWSHLNVVQVLEKHMGRKTLISQPTELGQQGLAQLVLVT